MVVVCGRLRIINMNFDDYENLPTPSAATNMMAGAAAGVLEHCVMYPMDSIKVDIFALFTNFPAT